MLVLHAIMEHFENIGELQGILLQGQYAVKKNEGGNRQILIKYKMELLIFKLRKITLSNLASPFLHMGNSHSFSVSCAEDALPLCTPPRH